MKKECIMLIEVQFMLITTALVMHARKKDSKSKNCLKSALEIYILTEILPERIDLSK